MRVTFIGSSESESVTRFDALGRLLQQRGHVVTMLRVSDTECRSFERASRSLVQRLRRLLLRRARLPHAWDLLASQLAPKIVATRPDWVVASGAARAYAATRIPAGRLAVDVSTVECLHKANSWDADPSDLAATREREAAVLDRATLVVVPHRDLEETLKQVFPGRLRASGTVLAPSGVDARSALPFAPGGCVVCSSPAAGRDDPLLRSVLLRHLPRPARALGAPGRQRAFLPEPPPPLGPGEFVCSGLVTSLTDRLSRTSGGRVEGLIAFGLPVLVPRELRLSPALEAAVARYSEGSFVDDVGAALEPAALERRREMALALGRTHGWTRCLEPVLERLTG